MKIENTQVSGFETSLRGMRNPLNSWNRSDSFFGIVDINSEEDWEVAEKYVEKIVGREVDYDNDKDYRELLDHSDWLLNNGVLQRDDTGYYAEVAFIGPNDLDLAQRLIKSGPEHAKFLRQITVGCDITAPLYW